MKVCSTGVKEPGNQRDHLAGIRRSSDCKAGRTHVRFNGYPPPPPQPCPPLSTVTVAQVRLWKSLAAAAPRLLLQENMSRTSALTDMKLHLYMYLWCREEGGAQSGATLPNNSMFSQFSFFLNEFFPNSCRKDVLCVLVSAHSSLTQHEFAFTQMICIFQNGTEPITKLQSVVR